jgi:hypothetical protein
MSKEVRQQQRALNHVCCFSSSYLTSGFCFSSSEIGDGAGDSFFMRLDKQVGDDEAPSFFCPPFWNLENQSTAISIDSFGRHRKTAKFQLKKMHHFFKTL